MVRLLHLIPHDGMGGVEIAARSMAAKPPRGCDFRLVFLAGGPIGGSASNILASPFRSASNPLAHARVLRQVLRHPPDVAIFSLWRTVPVMLALKRLRPAIRLVYTLNNERTFHRVEATAAAAAVAAADEVWADSEATLGARLPPSFLGTSRTISFVSDRLPPVPAIPPVPRFVLWSRLSRQKRVDRAIDLIAQLVERGIDAEFDIYGPDDGERVSLVAKASPLGHRIRFHGPVARSDLPRIARGASFFLLPSDMEGMAMSCVEAMQLGLVPVVTPAGEMGRYVMPGVSGVLIDPNDPAAATDRVMALLADPKAYAAIRSAAIARWADAPLYADDVCAAAVALAARRRPSSELQ